MKYGDRIKIILPALALLACGTALAQSPVPVSTNSDAPIEITASETLEWHRNDNQYIAKGAVKATQNDTTLYSDRLTADYREGATSSMEIYRLTADANVRIQSADTMFYGEKAVYEVDQAYAVMTGNNLKMESPDQVVTARDKMEYWSTKREALAIGNAKVVRGKDTINADVIKAVFKETSGGQQIDTLHANGHVVIVTPTETLTGDRGIYYSATNKAEIHGNVKIVRGPNVLEGDRGEVDLNTNISRIFGGPTAAAGTGDGRVRGVFYPGSDKQGTVTNSQTPVTPQGQPQAIPAPPGNAPVVTAPGAPIKSPPLFNPPPQGTPQ